jgi:hypothetical protein|tara:strand:- start:12096 stop:12803 length:708 start_codon:yes stop_codon:yes gene_type:complete
MRVRYNDLKSGDIVKFKYEGEYGSGFFEREVIIFARYVAANRLVHGLEITKNNRIVLDDGELTRYIPAMANQPYLIRDGEVNGKPYYRINIPEGGERAVYSKFKTFLKEDAFRSYKIKELKAANIQKITPTLPPSFVREADKKYKEEVEKAVRESKKKPSQRKIGDQKANEEVLDKQEQVVDVKAVQERITKEVNQTVETMMKDLGAVLKDDQMSDLLSAVQTKKAFGDLDDIGK